VARHIFQACPVWIYTQTNITQAFKQNVWQKLQNNCLLVSGVILTWLT
jgi:hypothetical protein